MTEERKFLEEYNCFSEEMSPILKAGVDTINTEAPYKMRLMMAASELITFASMLRKPMQLPDGSIIPVNAITFILSGSGTAKDSSMNMIRKPLVPAYAEIHKIRIANAKKQAENLAIQNGKEPEEWMSFYSAPRDLFAGISTYEGMIKHFGKLEAGRFGAGYLQVSELGSELQTSKHLMANIEALSVGYDTGYIPPTLVKSDDLQLPTIKNLPICGLLFGSFDIILYDEAVKEKFLLAFSTKLSRRSWVHYNTTVTVKEDTGDVKKNYLRKKRRKEEAAASQLALEKLMTPLVSTTTADPLTLTEDADMLYETYMDYNDKVATGMSKLYPVSILSRKHSHWKALKFACVLAILNGRETIELEDVIYAIRFTEHFASDLREFEVELAKEKYEVFTDYMHTRATDGKATITAHALRKLGYISKTGNIDAKMMELVKMASSSDPDGIYSVHETKIFYERIEKTDIIGASWIAVDNSGIQKAVADHRPKSVIMKEKSKVAQYAITGYTYSESDFPTLGGLLGMDMAFTPFKLHDSTRGKENTHGHIKWVCLDIDDSKITDQEAHEILSTINHHIARTSDPDNPFKFRLILELDAAVDIPDKIWVHFLKSLQDFLAINIDLISRSHIVFGYAGREILSVTDQEPLNAKEHLMYAHSAEAAKPKKPQLTEAQRKAALSTPLSTFGYAFEAGHGEGSRKMIGAAHHANKLGLSNHDIEMLMHEINDYWEYPMSAQRLETTILSQVRRF